MNAFEELRERLVRFNRAPFLFVGAGVSRRYLGLDGWVDLLTRMASHTSRPYAYFVSKADAHLPAVASEIAAAFHEIWWSDPAFEDSRAEFGDTVSRLEGPLKVEVARYIIGATAMPVDTARTQELALLRDAVLDGVITTNYDGLLEQLFPDFRVFVGQDQLLFSDSQGIGEIYKIHGSATEPETLVLTLADYERFNERNPYLAAKLLTIFVEHPVIFLGYSLNDRNVTDILVSVARVLTTDNLSRLQDRLIFVEWDPGLTEPTLSSTQIAVSGFTIPVILLRAGDFRGVFKVLGTLRRKFPAQLLRRLKEQVYELVMSSDPGEELAVVDIDDDTRAASIEVVFGVGVRARLARHGYVGLTREDLLMDVLQPESSYEAKPVVDDALPRVLKTSGSTPIYRYLRTAGLLRDDGTLLPDAVVDSRVRKRVQEGATPFAPYKQSLPRAKRLNEAAHNDFTRLAQDAKPEHVFLAVLDLPRKDLSLEELRGYLLDHADAFHGRNPTSWAKAVSLYDYYRYGTVDLADHADSPEVS